MQGFIDCIRQDDVLYNPDSVINTLILNVNVGVIVSPQLCILLQLLLYKYIIPIKLFYFSRPFWILRSLNNTVQIHSPSQHHFLKNILNRPYLQMMFLTRLNWWVLIRFICTNVRVYFWLLVLCCISFNFSYA